MMQQGPSRRLSGVGLGQDRTAGQARKLKAERGCTNVIPMACICPHPYQGVLVKHHSGSCQHCGSPFAATSCTLGLVCVLRLENTLGPGLKPCPGTVSYPPCPCRSHGQWQVLPPSWSEKLLPLSEPWFLEKLGHGIKKHDGVGPKGKHCIISRCWHFSSFCK